MSAHDEAERCRALWITVLAHALCEEATGFIPHVRGRRKPGCGYTRTTDFERVCSLAGFDPDAIRERLPRIDPQSLRARMYRPKGEAG